MDAEELLVEKGTNVNASTLNEETIIDPEVAEKLDELENLISTDHVRR